MSHLRGEGPEEAAYAGPNPPDALMHEPRIAYVSGGHLTTVLQEEKFIETIRAFLPSLGE